MGFRCMLLKGGLFFVFVCEKKMKIYFYKVSKLYIITNFWGSSSAARRDDSARKRFFSCFVKAVLFIDKFCVCM